MTGSAFRALRARSGRSRQIRVSISISSAVQRTTWSPFASPSRSGRGPAEAGRGREHERAPGVVVERLERVSFDGRALVDVPPEDELRAGRRERLEHRVAVLERELPRGPPGRACEVVVADDDPQRAGRGVGEDRPRRDARRAGPSRPP